jgi:hypothetical protein
LVTENCRLSTALTVNVDEPRVVGVPLKTPEALKVRPGGAAPVEIENVYGEVPPEALIVCE